MAIGASEPTAEINSTSNLTAYSLAAFTPSANATLVVFVFASGTVAAGTMSGGSLTWTRATSQVYNSTSTAYVFWANTGGSPGSTTITFDCTGDAATGCVMAVVEFTGTDSSNPIRQVKKGSATSANPSVTFNHALLTGNGYAAGFGVPRNPPTATEPGSWTKIADTGYGTPNAGGAVAYRAGGETGTTYSFTSASAAWGMIAVEVNASGASAHPDAYVIAGCTHNGNGTANSCAASAGAAGAYNSMQNAIDDLRGSTGTITIYASGTASDSTAINMANMAASTVVVVGDGTYTAENSDYSNNFIIAENSTWTNCKFGKSGSTALSVNMFELSATSGTFNRCEFYNTGTWTSDGGQAMVRRTVGSPGGNIIFANCYFHNAKTTAVEHNTDDEANVLYFNNLFKDNAGDGLLLQNDSGHAVNSEVKNNISDGNSGSDFSLSNANLTTASNISSDATSPESGLRNITITYHADGAPKLDDAETDAIDAGTDLSAHGVFPVTVDYYGTSRPQNSVFDIGAYEKAAAVAYTPLDPFGASGFFGI